MDYHHELTVLDGIHIAHSFEYANALGRESATGLVPADIDKIALQKDNNTFWLLTGVAPTTWQLVSFSPAAQDQLAALVESAEASIAFRSVVVGDTTVSASPTKSSLVLKQNTGVVLSVDSEERIGVGLAPDIISKVNLSGMHGALSGLNFDHHLHYLNETRHQEVGRHQLIVIDPLTDEPWRDPVTGKISGCIPHDDLNGLTNVKIANLLAKQVLTFNGGYWQNMSLPIATTTQNGLMSSSDKTALNGLISSSDERLKKNTSRVADVMDPLSVLQQLDAVYFNWDTSKERVAGYGDKREIGLIAQQVEPLLPEVVGEDSSGYKTLDYAKIVPVLIEAIKKLQKQVDEQQIQIGLLMGA